MDGRLTQLNWDFNSRSYRNIARRLYQDPGDISLLWNAAIEAANQSGNERFREALIPRVQRAIDRPEHVDWDFWDAFDTAIEELRDIGWRAYAELFMGQCSDQNQFVIRFGGEIVYTQPVTIENAPPSDCPTDPTVVAQLRQYMQMGLQYQPFEVYYAAYQSSQDSELNPTFLQRMEMLRPVWDTPEELHTVLYNIGWRAILRSDNCTVDFYDTYGPLAEEFAWDRIGPRAYFPPCASSAA